VIRKVIRENNLVKYPIVLTMMVHLPTWISMALGIRVLSCGFDLAGYPGVTEGMEVGGILWFHNLLQTDPYVIFPVLFPLSIWLRTEVCMCLGNVLVTMRFQCCYLDLY